MAHAVPSYFFIFHFFWQQKYFQQVNGMKNFIVTAIAVFSLTGCALLNQFNPFYSEPPTEQEKPVKEETQAKKEIQQQIYEQTEPQEEPQAEPQSENKAATQPIQITQKPKNNPAVKQYTGVTKQELTQAIKNVLYLMDTKDAKIIQQDDTVINYRFYTDTINDTYIFGYDTWAVTLEEQEDNAFAVSVMVGIAQELTKTPTSSLLPKTPDDLYFNIHALDEAQSMLFFERVDYFLGKNPTWRSCENIQNWVKENKYRGKFQDSAVTNSADLPFICGHNWYGIEDRDPSFLDKKK